MKSIDLRVDTRRDRMVVLLLETGKKPVELAAVRSLAEAAPIAWDIAETEGIPADRVTYEGDERLDLYV